MIGVLVESEDELIAEEFFELFKTEWEFARRDRPYEVLIGGSRLSENRCGIQLLFSSAPSDFDVSHGIRTELRAGSRTVKHVRSRFPIYGGVITFPNGGTALLEEERSGEAVLFAIRFEQQTVVRVGYNLFAEIRALLATGQPPEWSSVPTLECHLELLRDIITRGGQQLIEIPPVPAGYPFMVCVTHDVDHPVKRNHKWDATMLGFLYRAGVVTPIQMLRKRVSVRRVAQNWKAILKLPLIHLGLAEDDWKTFEQYLVYERGMGSTFFVIPQPNNPGRTRSGAAPAKRGCRYTLNEIAPVLERIINSGGEVGVHGIDAWLEKSAGVDEKAALSRIIGERPFGVRMHWLYSDVATPEELEAAGFTYDSSFGYNQTIGYRAGTTQVYRPIGRKSLMELPLHIMDTALFYPDHLNLTETEAAARIRPMIEHVNHFGGVLTINWHDRSIFPERLWGDFYQTLLDQLKDCSAWFPTAGQSVAWFRQRRHARIDGEMAHVAAPTNSDQYNSLPGLVLRTYRPCSRGLNEALAARHSEGYADRVVGSHVKNQA